MASGGSPGHVRPTETSVWDQGHPSQTGPRWSSLKEREGVARYNRYLCIVLARPQWGQLRSGSVTDAPATRPQEGSERWYNKKSGSMSFKLAPRRPSGGCSVVRAPTISWWTDPFRQAATVTIRGVLDPNKPVRSGMSLFNAVQRPFGLAFFALDASFALSGPLSQHTLFESCGHRRIDSSHGLSFCRGMRQEVHANTH